LTDHVAHDIFLFLRNSLGENQKKARDTLNDIVKQQGKIIRDLCSLPVSHTGVMPELNKQAHTFTGDVDCSIQIFRYHGQFFFDYRLPGNVHMYGENFRQTAFDFL